MIRSTFRAAALAAVLLALSACAKQTLPGAVAPDAPGFVFGLWHGFIFPVAWVLSLFMPEVAVYAVPNNGWPYDFGFFLGFFVFGAGVWRGRKVVVRERIVREPREPRR